MQDEPLWTVRATARYLSVSETTLRAWQTAHLLPFLKIGGSIRFVPEGYVDLDYDAGGKLVIERVKTARDPAETARRAVEFARAGEVESICIHGDGPNAVELAAAVRAALTEAGVDLAPL